MGNMTIRKMNETDPVIISEAFRLQGWEKQAKLYSRYVEEQKNGDRVTLVAEINGEFAGYVNVVWSSSYPSFQELGVPEIQDFNVLIRFQRQGIGTMLMDEAEQIIGERSDVAGIGVGLFSDYGAAQVLYVNRGYVPDGKGIFQNDGYPHYGEQVTVDDDLALYLIKRLR